MRKRLLIASIVFFIFSFLILFFSPGSVLTLQKALNNSDILSPFSVYQGILEKTSHSGWLFGGYTPFLDLLIGFILWLITRNIQLTFTINAVLQPVMVALCLVFLSQNIVGKNRGVAALVFVFTTLPILVFSTGHLQFIYALFSWYLHISTVCLALLGLGWTVRYLSAGQPERKLFHPDLLGIGAVTVIAVLSDPIFLAQFVVPAISLIILVLILKISPFRRAAIAGILILYATAAGLAMYQLPRLWGSDRIVLYGSYMKPALDRIIDNWPLLLKNISTAFEGKSWIAGICIFFTISCAGAAGLLLWKHRGALSGQIRKRYWMALVFFLAQMVFSIGSSLIANEPSERYFLPALLVPLFWGWPILLLGVPGWLKSLRGKRATTAAGLLLIGFAALLLIKNILSQPASERPNLAEYYPNWIQCLDENTSRLNLHRGIAHYWQARLVTLLSKNQLVVVQVYPDLTPLPILNNSDSYQADFDFVIIDNAPPPGIWIDRELIYRRFGEPAMKFSCSESDILVYNRESDRLFRRQFDPAPAEGN